MAVLQSLDGYIWIGTFEGFVRFDGIKFTRIDSGQVKVMGDSTITTLYKGPDRTLSIGHATGGRHGAEGRCFHRLPAPGRLERELN